MRKWLNRVRASRDAWRTAIYRRRYDRPRLEVDQVTDLERIVFLRWDAKWGDSVIFSLVVPALREAHPDVSIEVITTPEMAPLFADQFGVDRVYPIRKRPSGREIRQLAGRIGEVDLLVHFSELAKHRDIQLLGCVQARHVASLDDSVGLVDVKLGKATQGLHMEDRYRELLLRCGVPEADKRYLVPRDQASEDAVDTFLQERERPYIAINPFSKGRAKTFNVKSTLGLIDRLLKPAPGYDVCLLTAPGWDAEVKAIQAGWDPKRCFSYPQTGTIYDNVALLARAQAQVSASTATVHMADGLGVPSLVLFPYGPGEMAAWHSVHPTSVNLMSEPGAVPDVNRLDWARVEAELDAFLGRLQVTERRELEKPS